MTMVSSGPISLGGNATTGGLNQSINIELGQSATATISLNDSNVRTLLGKASGAISLSDAYGKANQFAFTISSNQTNANLRTLAVNAGWNQSSKVVATISGGVFISSNSTGTPGLTINGSFPGGVDLINNGTIAGMGGNGGVGGSVFSFFWSFAGAGATGGLALSVSSAVTITNNGTIAGGGGGGGGGAAGIEPSKFPSGYGGGGGGGGRTGLNNSSGGGAGSGYFAAGRAGAAGTSGGAGAGGRWNDSRDNNWLGVGGNGGGWGSAGATGGSSPNSFGSWWTSGPAGGGGAGAAVTGNGNITWLAFGSRFGGIS